MAGGRRTLERDDGAPWPKKSHQENKQTEASAGTLLARAARAASAAAGSPPPAGIAGGARRRAGWRRGRGGGGRAKVAPPCTPCALFASAIFPGCACPPAARPAICPGCNKCRQAAACARARLRAARAPRPGAPLCIGGCCVGLLGMTGKGWCACLLDEKSQRRDMPALQTRLRPWAASAAAHLDCAMQGDARRAGGQRTGEKTALPTGLEKRRITCPPTLFWTPYCILARWRWRAHHDRWRTSPHVCVRAEGALP